MPIWAQFILATVAVFTALGVLWSKVLRPGAFLITSLDAVRPLLVDLTHELRDAPDAFKILKEIVAQVRTNSGSSLHDAINRIDAAAKENHEAAETLKVHAEVARRLAEDDRKQLARLVTLMNFIEAQLGVVGRTGDRIEESQAEGVADALERRQRADSIESSAPPGTAADAGSRGPLKK